MKNRLNGKRLIVGSCWIWTGCTRTDGYGAIKVSGKTQAVHRVAFEAYHGPIEDGNVVLHRCDNRKCFNPAHLTQGTQRENIADCIQKGRFKANGRPRGVPKVPFSEEMRDDIINGPGLIRDKALRHNITTREVGKVLFGRL